MTQHQICERLWVGDDQYNGEDYDYVIDLTEWDAEKTFEGKNYKFIDYVLKDVDIGRTHGKTLVHCHGGMDRSPFICAMYLHVYQDIHPHEAYGAVQKRRPQTIVHFEWMYPYLEHVGFKIRAD